MLRTIRLGVAAGVLAALAGCSPDYSPDTYSASAVQQANKVESAVVVGFREVKISANGTVGAVTGGAAGGILGAESSTLGFNSALGAVAGTAVGGVIGNSIEHATGDTTGWEYIVRKTNGDLLSLTQREPKPLPLGQRVLVITGSQARIVPDYSVPMSPPAHDLVDGGGGRLPTPSTEPFSPSQPLPTLAIPDPAPAATPTPAEAQQVTAPAPQQTAPAAGSTGASPPAPASPPTADMAPALPTAEQITAPTADQKAPEGASAGH